MEPLESADQGLEADIIQPPANPTEVAQPTGPVLSQENVRVLLELARKLGDGSSVASSEVSDTDGLSLHETEDQEELMDEDVDESLGDPIAESITRLVTNRSTKPDQAVLSAKLRKVKRPANLEVTTPRVNPEVWESLSVPSKNRDKR